MGLALQSPYVHRLGARPAFSMNTAECWGDRRVAKQQQRAIGSSAVASDEAKAQFARHEALWEQQRYYPIVGWCVSHSSTQSR
jgi:hypothetical protein